MIAPITGDRRRGGSADCAGVAEIAIDLAESRVPLLSKIAVEVAAPAGDANCLYRLTLDSSATRLREAAAAWLRDYLTRPPINFTQTRET